MRCLQGCEQYYIAVWSFFDKPHFITLSGINRLRPTDLRLHLTKGSRIVSFCVVVGFCCNMSRAFY